MTTKSSNPALLSRSSSFEGLLSSLGIDGRVVESVKKLGFERPTLVQSESLPLAIESGRDLLVRAKAGSGKTLAYAIPVLHKIISSASSSKENKKDFCKAVILVPTRELCFQVHNVLQDLTKYCDELVKVAVLSGDDFVRQECVLRDLPDVIVSTPASLLRHIREETVNLRNSVETLVLDEADLILSFGYKSDIDEIVKSLPNIYQGFLMSATLEDLEGLERIVLHNPLLLKLEEDAKQGELMQYYLKVPKHDRYLLLYVFIKLGVLRDKGLFFVNGIDAGYRLKLFFEQFHISSVVLNSELPLQSRLSIIQQYNAGYFNYLIATDDSTDVQQKTSSKSKNKHKKRKKDEEYGVSRGVDFQRVAFVVNVDFPPNPQSYTHRVGRTARAGKRGIALSLVDEKNPQHLELISLLQASLPQLPLPKADDTLLPAAASAKNSNSLIISQPALLDFNLRDLEGFRYRVEDVSRAVTKNAVRQARATELQAEILNNERVQGHLDKLNFNLLQHHRTATHSHKIHDHLKNVPDYILPRGMQVAKIRNKKRKQKHKKEPKKRNHDPLREFDDVTLDDLIEQEGA